MNTLTTMYAISANLALMNEAQRKGDLRAARVAVLRAKRLIIEFARARMVAGEPASLARCIINAAAGRAMGRRHMRSPRLRNPGRSGAVRGGSTRAEEKK